MNGGLASERKEEDRAEVRRTSRSICEGRVFASSPQAQHALDFVSPGFLTAPSFPPSPPHSLTQGLAGLSYNEILHLEKLVAALQQAFPAVAHLPPHEHQALFASEVGEGGRAGGRKEEEEDGVRLHALIEEKESSLERIR